jgi:hypothetical protein
LKASETFDEVTTFHPAAAAYVVKRGEFPGNVVRRLRIFGQRDKLKADRSKGA